MHPNQIDCRTQYLHDTQPEIWRQPRAHIRDFSRTPHEGISFVSTSDDALRRMGGVQLKFCDNIFTIRKNLSYDKLYFVDLLRLPADVPDMAINDCFVARGSRPIFITPTQGHKCVLRSLACPEQLFEPNGDPLREITFVDGENPCFVQHRLRRYKKVTPPSLRPQPRRPSEISDTCMDSAEDDTPSLPSSDPEASLSTTSQPVQTTPLAEESPSTIPSSGPGHSTQPEPDLSRKIILGSVGATAVPSWQLVQHSQYGAINREGPKFLEPDSLQSCDLRLDDSNPHALVYSIPVMPNM
ncbi:hypothetical protein PsorP6_012966 [Peronosclerospora sorghi]|uniref:Uncharacterized protein n=1 Tax=Peronosclerospora sorghi TaxID=230839 RepID=A0ACC0WIT1_9STRA|nr:hypothetical protein PsorP6_012966 [Peronosclerospora sorghi]